MTTSRAKSTTPWLWFALVVGAAAAGVRLSAQALAALASFHQRTAHLCDGTLPIPQSSFVYAWTGAAASVLAVVALFPAVRAMSRRVPRPVAISLTAILALGACALFLSAGWTILDVYHDAQPVTRVCGG